MSIFVLNIATMLGLALAIDYSLFIVSRYREELRRGRTVGEAVERAIATAGKAVTFSGIAVAIGLSGLLLFEAPGDPLDRDRRGARGPLLGGLRPDLPAGGARDARAARQRPVARRPGAAASARPPDVATPTPSVALGARSPTRVMRRPIAVLVPTLAPPAGRRQPGPPPRAGRARAPRSTRPASRAATPTSRCRPSSPPARRRPIVILADVPGSPTDVADDRAPSPTTPTGSPRSMGSTGSRARSPSATRRPASPLTPEQVAALYALPGAPAARRALDALLERYVRGSTVRLDAISPIAAGQAGGDRPDPGHPRDGRRATGSPPRSAAAPRPATTSSSRRASARRGRSA